MWLGDAGGEFVSLLLWVAHSFPEDHPGDASSGLRPLAPPSPGGLSSQVCLKYYLTQKHTQSEIFSPNERVQNRAVNSHIFITTCRIYYICISSKAEIGTVATVSSVAYIFFFVVWPSETLGTIWRIRKIFAPDVRYMNRSATSEWSAPLKTR